MNVKLNRRKFLEAGSVTLSAALLPPVILNSGAFPGSAMSARTGQPQVVIYQDKAHFDDSGLLDPYIQPRRMTSNQDYVESVDEVSFLSRHWFT